MRVYDGELSIAAINSSVSCFVGQKILQTIQKELNKQTFLPRLSGEVAYHSHQMDPIKDQFLTCEPHQTEISKLRLYSTVTGG